MEKKKLYKEKNYKHIDKPFDIYKHRNIMNKIQDKEYVTHHAFYPFVSSKISFKKYSEEIIKGHHYKFKDRPIKYASHIDRYIYQWYSSKLNQAYNVYCNEHDLNKCSVAYRTCLRGKTNIEFASMAFKKIKELKECYVLVSDFSDFFDTLEHSILKQNICKVLKVNKLENDWYKVFRSMTVYSYVERQSIIDFLIDNKYETDSSILKLKSFFESISWNDAKKNIKIIRHDDEYGIPQGSPLSGIFANVFMIDFDYKLNEYAKSKNGLYMRYSDDLILIIPKDEVNSIDDLWNYIVNLKRDYKYLKINESKTSGYVYENGLIKSLHNESNGFKISGNFIPYLGFSFDGTYIKFRDKTLTKFFYKMYRKIDSMVEREQYRILLNKKKKSKIDKHWILKQLKQGNGEDLKFVTYVNRAKRVFPNEKYIVSFKDMVKKRIFIRFNKFNSKKTEE